MNASRSSSKNDSTTNQSELDLSFDESVLQLIDEPFQMKVNQSKLRTDFKYSGFDSTMGNTWIYPTNYPIRQYQLHISRVSLYKNTLVCLPTGLGKTFIASVVMYNIFRWYPKGKIIFMAPTRPLVAQQIDACYQIMGFPKDETVELTGRQNKKIRATAWHKKRVFYCTPQVVWSDLNDDEINFPINDVKLIVIDEAHKAKGKYAYTEVVQSIWSRNKLFRVLALSATPGRTMKDVCEVIQNLLISNVEVRRESSIDVVPYVFKKNIKSIVVPLDDRLKQIRQRLNDLVEPYVENLVKYQVITGHIGNMTKAWLLFDRNKFRESTISNRHPEQSKINGDFSVCISMYHAIELLERHGLRVFLNYFNDTNNSDSSAEEKFFVMKDLNIKQFINEIRLNSGITPFTDQDMSFHGNTFDIIDIEPIDYGHPKFEILQKCLLDHFQEHSDTKSIVFCEYRESVFLINRMLLSNRPLIKPKVFVGQGSSHNRTITQKEQIAIMNDFRSGKCNTLIATCVAEEGIDVGEVDFIVCFDVNNKNPIRFVQRIGRTGRKRQGKVTMLVTEGKEQQILRDVLATKDGINQKIGKSNEVKNVLYNDCPRLVPPEFNPQLVETFIDIASTEDAAAKKVNGKKETKAKSTKTKNKSPKQNEKSKSGGVRHFFKPIEMEVDKEMDENFDLSSFRGHTSTEQRDSLICDQLEIDHPDLTCNQSNEFVEQNVSRTHDVDNDVPLEVNFEKVYSQYCDIKRDRSKWNGFGEKLSKSNKTNNNMPDILRKFLTNYSKESNENRVFKTNLDPWQSYSHERRLQILQVMSLLTQQSKLNANKSKLSVCDPTNQKNDTEVELHRNSWIDSQVSFSMQMEHQSKYASQLKAPTDRNEPTMAPLQQIACSTPHKITNFEGIHAAPIHSPIVNSPLANKLIQMYHRNRNHRRDGDPKWYLKFLGLNTVYDLFSDDSDECLESTSNITANRSDEQQAKLCDTLNKSVCGNENLIEEESQYTVSRILKICEDAERADVQKREPKPSGSTIRRRRLYIGSVDDLFCEKDGNDNDDDDDDNVIINTQAVDVTLSESDDTVNYDVEDAMAQRKSIHHSKFFFKDTIGCEPFNKLTNTPAKSVTGVKSDELFSTFNESLANMSKPSGCNDNNRTQPKTPTKNKNSNFFVYHSRSPSILIKSSSILSARLDNNQAEQSICNTSKTCSNQSNKSPKMLCSKLSVLNTQLSKHLEDLNEVKENFSSPFFVVRSPNIKHNENNHLQPEADSNCDTEFSENEVFMTCKTTPPKKKPTLRQVKKKRKVRGRFNFIDDEAAVSGDESSDDDFINTQTQHLNVTEQCEEDDSSVDMQAKYLQSIRSPISRHRHFHIPSIGYRNPTATQNIFSQFVAPDQSRYEEDSFVVGSDEEEETDEENIHSDCTELSNDASTDLDEITIAPIRPNKRKSDEIKQSKVKKRLRIIEMSSDSD